MGWSGGPQNCSYNIERSKFKAETVCKGYLLLLLSFVLNFLPEENYWNGKFFSEAKPQR
jgi:hypothetical protein